jgi:hypothetical protein
MSAQVTVVLTNGQIITGINYRMDPSLPAVPASAGMYHIQTKLGWVDIPSSEILSISLQAGRPT